MVLLFIKRHSKPKILSLDFVDFSIQSSTIFCTNFHLSLSISFKKLFIFIVIFSDVIVGQFLTFRFFWKIIKLLITKLLSHNYIISFALLLFGKHVLQKTTCHMRNKICLNLIVSSFLNDNLIITITYFLFIAKELYVYIIIN